MRSTLSGWEVELAQWLKPFLDRLGHKARRRMCPLYVTGLIGPGDRKSVQPMAERLAPGDYDQLHHFVAAGVWDAAPLETELLIQADRLVGGSDAVVDGESSDQCIVLEHWHADCACPKSSCGGHSFAGVKREQTGLDVIGKP